jgi:hypothetical protein
MSPRTQLIILLLTLLILAGCGRRQAEEPTPVAPTARPAATAPVAPTPTAAPTAAPTVVATVAATAAPIPAAPATADSGSAQEGLMAALVAQQNGGPYRVQTTVVTGDTTMEMLAEIVPPDRLRSVTNTGGIQVEIIIIGDTAYIKNGDTPWVSLPDSGFGSQILGALSSEALMEQNLIADVQRVGQETVDGESAIIYAFQSSFGEGEDALSAMTRIWVSESRGLPLRVENEGEIDGSPSRTVQIVQYDTTITIEPPIQ